MKICQVNLSLLNTGSVKIILDLGENNLLVILAIDQLNEKNFFIIGLLYMPLHVSSTMCSSSGGQIVLYSIWYCHTL